MNDNRACVETIKYFFITIIATVLIISAAVSYIRTQADLSPTKKDIIQQCERSAENVGKILADQRSRNYQFCLEKFAPDRMANDNSNREI